MPPENATPTCPHLPHYHASADYPDHLWPPCPTCGIVTQNDGPISPSRVPTASRTVLSSASSPRSPTSPLAASPMAATSIDVASGPTTPPILLSPVPSRPHNGYFGTKAGRPKLHESRTASPLSFKVGSLGSSVCPSENGASSDCSELLSPPETPIDYTEPPPYIASQDNYENLTILTSPKSEVGNPFARQKPYQCHHKQRIQSQERSNSDVWHVAGCQIVPTAPKQLQKLCEGHVGKSMPKHPRWWNSEAAFRPTTRYTDTTLKRRWSSVEIGTHQVHVSPKKRKRNVGYSAVDHVVKLNGSSQRSNKHLFSASFYKAVRSVRAKLKERKVPAHVPDSIRLKEANDSPSIDTGTAQIPQENHKFSEIKGEGKLVDRRESAYLITGKDLESIAEMIATNMTANTQPQASISTHSASSVFIFQPTRLPQFGQKGLIPRVGSPAQSTLTVAEVQVSCLNPLDDPKFESQSSTFGKQGMHEVIWKADGTPLSIKNEAGDALITVKTGPEMHNESPKASTISTASSLSTRVQVSSGHKSVIAAIDDWSWEDSASLLVPRRSSNNNSSTIEEGGLPGRSRRRPAMSSFSETSVPRLADSSLVSPNDADHESYEVVSFPPLPRKKTSEWLIPVTDIDSETEKPKERRLSLNKQRSLHGMGIDATLGTAVKRTGIAFTSPQRSLHDRGIGALTGPSMDTGSSTSLSPTRTYGAFSSSRASVPQIGIESVSLPLAKSNQVSRSSLQAEPEISIGTSSHPPKINIRVSSASRPDGPKRRKSSVKAHPKSTARLGSAHTLGSSLGSSSKQKRPKKADSRKASTESTESVHVKCVDNRNRPSSRSTTWSKVRPPSVCPHPDHSIEASSISTANCTRHNSTDAANTDTADDGSNHTSNNEGSDMLTIGKEKRKGGANGKGKLFKTPSWQDREAMLDKKTPQFLKPDHAGIYDELTGVKRDRSMENVCEEADCEHPHVCSGESDGPSVDWIG